MDQVKRVLENLSIEARELYIDKEVPVLDKALTPLEFYRKQVASNKPVVINNAIKRWPALTKWSNQYLRDKIGTKEVTVAVTPNGYADAVTDGKFVLPEQRSMSMSAFLDIMENPGSANGIFYVQKQNSNLTDEFVSIMGDVEELSWGSEAFDKKPDAVNFWMGDHRAVTSMHRDHYENLYCVVRGWKKFTLLPPTDLPYVPYGSHENFVMLPTLPKANLTVIETFDVGTFKEVDGKFIVEDNEDMEKVPWIALDPLSPDYDRFPAFKSTCPIEVTVHAGQVLYLPSLWFHHVQQSHGCIAVNYWYDMEFDIKYNYYKCIESLVDITK